MGTERPSLVANQNPLLQASRWIEIPLLVEPEEMSALLTALTPFEIFATGVLCLPGQEQVTPERFLSLYGDYVEALKQGKVPEEGSYRPFFSTLWTRTRDALAVQEVDHKWLVRASLPVIQLRPHRFSYSEHDGKFRSMILGRHSITWGIQFSYPQLFQNQATYAIETVSQNPNYPNNALFHALQHWVRHHTVPTPFSVGGKRVNTPMRVSKRALSWLGAHPQLRGQPFSILEGLHKP